jgi:SAM-dependent methyltransferase
MLREIISHPIASIRFIVKRLARIPQLGLPNFSIGRRDEFDRKLGIDTAILVRMPETDSENRAHGRGYQASDISLVEWALASAGVAFERTTFVDIGCGKGRVLILASRHPFKRIVGFDYSPSLLVACRKNLRHLDLEGRCETFVADAASFQFPEGKLMLFMFNPFDSPLFEAVLERIRQIDAPVTVAYLGPERKTLECNWLHKIAESGAIKLYRTSSPNGSEA